MVSIRFVLTLIILILTGLLVFVSPEPTLSQSDGNTCLPIVQQILTQVGERCGELERNSACYGNSTIAATFVESVTADTFATPGDKTEVT